MYAQQMEMGGYSHLMGTQRFQSATAINNWFEEREIRRSALQNLLLKKSMGTLRLDAYHQRMGTALTEVELTKVADDGFVHIGDMLQVVHMETGFVLAGDVATADSRPAEQACAATAAPDVRAPCARNTFVLLKYVPDRIAPLEPSYDDDTLHYGQKVRLALNAMASGHAPDSAGGPRPLCLFSKPPSMTHYAKYSRKQLVGLTARDTYDTVWQVMTPNPAERVASEGVEVMAGAPVLLVHCATQQPLMVEAGQVFPNEFGDERELTARQSVGPGMKLAMEQTSKGLFKGSLPKPEDPSNHFTFITGEKVERLPDGQPGADGPAGPALVVKLVEAANATKGTLALLEKKLVTLSNEKNELPMDELLMIVRQAGCSLPDADVDALASAFPTHKRGVMDAGALLGAIRMAKAC